MSQQLGRLPGWTRQDRKPGWRRQGEALGRRRQGEALVRRRQGEALVRRRQGEALGRRRQGEAHGRRRQGEELERLRDGLLASRGLWNGLQALKGGRTLPPPPFLRPGCRSLVGRHWSTIGHNWGRCSFIQHRWGRCSFIGLQWNGLRGLLDWNRLWNSLLVDSELLDGLLDCHWRCSSLRRWGTSQEPHKLPKRKVIQPPHPPPAEGLIEDTVEHVLQCRMVEPQPLCCIAVPLGKHPYVSTLLTEAAQGPELEDALFGVGSFCQGWWKEESEDPIAGGK